MSHTSRPHRCTQRTCLDIEFISQLLVVHLRSEVLLSYIPLVPSVLWHYHRTFGRTLASLAPAQDAFAPRPSAQECHKGKMITSPSASVRVVMSNGPSACSRKPHDCGGGNRRLERGSKGGVAEAVGTVGRCTRVAFAAVVALVLLSDNTSARVSGWETIWWSSVGPHERSSGWWLYILCCWSWSSATLRISHCAYSTVLQ